MTQHTYTVTVNTDNDWDIDASMQQAMEYLAESIPGDTDMSILAERAGAIVTDYTYIQP